MASLSAIANSGLQAAQLRLDSAAHNVANMNTPNFRRQEVRQQSVEPQGGVQASLQRSGVEGTSLEQDVVEQMAATYAFKANIATLKTADQMMGSLLNVKA